METLDPSCAGAQPTSPDDGRAVLLVDDDAGLRAAMRDYLAAAGFRVLEAANSYDGLFLAAQCGPALRLLVTEVNLLPVSGIKLAENVLRLFPQTQVLCLSDCEETRPVKYWMKYLNASFLRKPFTAVDFHDRVNAILGDPWEEAALATLAAAAEPGVAEASGARGYSSNSADPAFWLREF